MDAIDKLKQVFEILEEDKASTKEVAEALANILATISQLAKEQAQTARNLKGLIEDSEERASELSERNLRRIENLIEGVKKSNSKAQQALRTELLEEIGRVAEAIPSLPDLSPLERRLTGLEAKEMPKFPLDDIERRFKELPLGDLKGEIQRLEQKIDSKPVGRTGMRKVPMLRVIDLTADVNGSATTFRLPRDTVKVHMVWGAQFPQVFRPDVDFTLSGNTLTLVSAQVGVMQSGQTLTALIETLFYA